MSILILGFGQLGRELCNTLSVLGNVDVVDYPQVNLAESSSIQALIEGKKPRIVVNAAAYTQVDKAEEERDLCWAINANAMGSLGKICGKFNIPVLHFSTDYVFDGKASKPLREEDPASPLGWYGESKLAGEIQLLNSSAPAVVLRTAWLYSLQGKNFLKTMMRLSREKTELKVVDDQQGCPTWARSLAEISAQLVGRELQNPGEFLRNKGRYHTVASGVTTWCGFTKAIVEELLAGPMADQIKLSSPASVLPIPSSEYPTPAARPHYSVLCTDKLFETWGLRIPDWRQQLSQCMAGLNLPDSQ